jgi:hypothetical protein
MCRSVSVYGHLSPLRCHTLGTGAASETQFCEGGITCTRFMTAILGSVWGGGFTSAATSRCMAPAAASAAACTSFSRDAAI